jgi:hypothetical protein
MLPEICRGKSMKSAFWPIAELPSKDSNGRLQRKTGPDEMSGRTAACDPKATNPDGGLLVYSSPFVG